MIDLTVNNIVYYAETAPEYIIDWIQEKIDGEGLAQIRPLVAVGIPGLEYAQHQYAYYGNLNGTILGLWARMRLATDRKNAKFVTIRDYLEEAGKACRLKYDAASRILTSYQEIRKDSSMERGRNV